MLRLNIHSGSGWYTSVVVVVNGGIGGGGRCSRCISCSDMNQRWKCKGSSGMSRQQSHDVATVKWRLVSEWTRCDSNAKVLLLDSGKMCDPTVKGTSVFALTNFWLLNDVYSQLYSHMFSLGLCKLLENQRLNHESFTHIQIKIIRRRKHILVWVRVWHREAGECTSDSNDFTWIPVTQPTIPLKQVCIGGVMNASSSTSLLRAIATERPQIQNSRSILWTLDYLYSSRSATVLEYMYWSTLELLVGQVLQSI